MNINIPVLILKILKVFPFFTPLIWGNLKAEVPEYSSQAVGVPKITVVNNQSGPVLASKWF